MKIIGFRLSWFLLLGFSLTGCSSLSEWYACGVDCQYHPRSPLPYEQYPECVCHSHVVSLPRQTLRQAPESEASDSDRDNETADENEQDKPAPYEPKPDES